MSDATRTGDTTLHDLLPHPFTRFQQILLNTDGTLTRVISAYAQEPIEAVKLGQRPDPVRESDAPLELPPGETVMRREVLLRGCVSQRNLLYAEAAVVPDRVPATVMTGLLETDKPIGTLLTATRTETFREILTVGRGIADTCAGFFGITPTSELIYRTYRIVIAKQPAMLITEKFPASFFLGIRDDVQL